MAPTELLNKTRFVPPILDPEHYEVIDGRVVETPRMGAEETWIANVLSQVIATFVRKNHLGRVAVEMMFSLGEGRNKRRPDLAFVSYSRWPRALRPSKGEAWDVVPDLAIEVISASNTLNEIAGKIRDYFSAGVAAVWVVIPDTYEIQVWDSQRECRVLHVQDALDGGTVLPGFRVPIAVLFDDMEDLDS